MSIAACAQTSIQPMSRDSFKVATIGDSLCGPAGTRNIAFRTAAIEVVRKGGDHFIVVTDQNDSETYGNPFTGYDSNYLQGMVIRMIDAASPEAGNALSARAVLGADWQEQVKKGAPTSCT